MIFCFVEGEVVRVVAAFHVVVVPAEELAGLDAGQGVGFDDEEGGGGDEGAGDEVDEVVVAEVHGGPPQPHDVEDEEGAELGEAVGEEEGFDGGEAGVQGWEGAEDDGGGAEAGGVQVDAEELVDGGETGGVAADGIVGWCEAVGVFVPGRRAGEAQLDEDAGHVGVSECAAKAWDCAWGSKDEEDNADYEGGTVVEDAVG